MAWVVSSIPAYSPLTASYKVELVPIGFPSASVRGIVLATTCTALLVPGLRT
nr:MAG TPA: hypothetical protein [Caudoviricetes sp.]